MPLYDFGNTTLEDLPKNMQPDPNCVWVWVVGPNTKNPDVCFDKDMAEQVREAKAADVSVKRTRLWFTNNSAEKRVHDVPGSGFSE